jgi:hypothetical protein
MKKDKMERSWSMEHGAWRMENGEWSMEHGEWSMEHAWGHRYTDKFISKQQRPCSRLDQIK